MPRIPQDNRSNLAQTEVPGANIATHKFGNVGSAIADVGAQIAQMGSDLLTKRKRAEDADFASNAAMNDSIETDKYSEQLKRETPEDGTGYAEKMKQFVQDRYKQNTENAPSDEARNMYSLHTQPLLAREVINSEGYQNTQRVKSYMLNDQKAADDSARRSEESPDPEKTLAQMAIHETGVLAKIGTTYSPAQAEIVSTKAKNQMAEGLFKGMHNREQYGPALALLKADNPIAKALTPDQMGAFIESMKHGIEKKSATEANDIQLMASNFVAGASKGYGASPQEANKLIAAINGNKNFKGMAKEQMLDTIRSSTIVGNFIHSASSKPLAEQMKLLDNLDSELQKFLPKGMGSNFNIEKRDMLITKAGIEVQENIRNAYADPSEYVARVDPKVKQAYEVAGTNPALMQKAIATSISSQVFVGVTPRVLNNSQAASMAEFFNKQPTAAAAAQALTNKENELGPYFQQAMQEAVAHGKMKDNVFIAAQMKDQGAREIVFGDIRNGEAQDTEFKSNPKTAVSHKTIKEEAANSLNDIRAALQPTSQLGESSDMTNSFQRHIELEAQRQVMNGSDPAVAVKNAYEKIISSSYETVPTNGKPILMPRVSGGVPTRSKFVQAYTEVYTQPENFKALGVSPEYDPENLSKTAQWVTNQGQTGMRLMRLDTDGKYRNVKGADGNIVERSFKDMSLSNDPLILKAVDKAMNPISSRLKSIFGSEPNKADIKKGPK